MSELEPNTVLTDWSEDGPKQADFTREIHRILQIKRSLLVYAETELPAAELAPNIDVWWRARENGTFMLTLANLLRRYPRWRNHHIRMMRVITDESRREEAIESVQNLPRRRGLTPCPRSSSHPHSSTT